MPKSKYFIQQENIIYLTHNGVFSMIAKVNESHLETRLFQLQSFWLFSFENFL